MTTWEFGLTEQPYDAVRSGSKTIEGRLKRGKFAEFKPGDTAVVRRDFERESDKEGELRVKVVAVREYANFAELCQKEGFQKVVPWVSTEVVAAETYEDFYSLDEQSQYGVLAIEIVPLLEGAGWDKLYRDGMVYKQLSDADVAQLVRYVPESTSRTALDIGCGAGELARQLQGFNFEVTGVDPSSEAITKAQQADKAGTYLVGDVSVVSGTFGVITCKLVYAFIEDRTQFLEEVRQRLDSKGFFVVLAPTHDHPINHKKGIHVNRETLYRELRSQFRIIHKQQTKLGVLVICRHKRVSLGV